MIGRERDMLLRGVTCGNGVEGDASIWMGLFETMSMG
jgi:hypothetical protein